MVRIAIVGDVHLATSHRCRQDDFLETALEKLQFIRNENDKVIILGDLFHVYSNPPAMFNRIYKFFTQENNKGAFATLVGNHDVFHGSLTSLNKTTIGSLQLTGALTLLTKSFTIDGYDFDVSPVVKDMSKLGDPTNTKILLGHNYFEFPVEEESFSRDEIKKLNYNTVLLGHEHCPYDDERVGNTRLIRMGSLTRIDTQPYNKTRKIYYCQLDTETGECIKREVPSKPIKECYVDGAFDKSPIKQKSVYGGLSALLSKFDNNVDKRENMSLPTVLRTMKASEAHITYLREIHRNNNIGFD